MFFHRFPWKIPRFLLFFIDFSGVFASSSTPHEALGPVGRAVAAGAVPTADDLTRAWRFKQANRALSVRLST